MLRSYGERNDIEEGCAEFQTLFQPEESKGEKSKFGKTYLAVLIVCVIVSTLIYCLHLISAQIKDEVELPNTLEKAKRMALLLQSLQQDNWYLVVAFFAMLYVTKQTFCIPGSVLLNLLAGNMFGLFPGFVLVSLLSSIGSSCCFVLSDAAGDWVIQRFPSDRLNSMKQKIKQQKEGGNLFGYLLFLRFVPAGSWFINLAAPILGIPFFTFVFSCMLGSMPYNFVTVNAGLVLASASSTEDFMSPQTLLQFVSVGLMVSFPFFVKLLRDKWLSIN